MSNFNTPIKVFILCSGLGQIWRGYESFYQEFFTAFSQDSELDITLFKGGGESQGKAIALWNLPRYSKWAIKLGRIQWRELKVAERWDLITEKQAYNVEEFTFFLSFLPYLMRGKPDAVYLSDRGLGNWLWHWRNLTKQKFKIVFRNGSPFPPPFPECDRVQQLTPTEFKKALDAGEPPEKVSFIPHGFNIPRQLEFLDAPARDALRSKLGLPQKRCLILSVGYVVQSHKRMDYVIQEVASLPEPRPYLLLIGQQDVRGETREIIKLAKQLLGEENFQVKTVPHDEISDYYKAADVFVLASLLEAFGRVFVEALSHGLPCLAHDYEVSRYILGEEGYFADFNLRGNLAKLIEEVLAESEDNFKRDRRHRLAYERFSWEQLRPAYIQMFQQCVLVK